jgi:rubredoxin
MSYKHVGTAGDLVRFGCALKIECTFCHAARTLNGVDVYQIHGNRQLTQLPRRLVCRRCKKKEAKVTVLDPVWPTLVGTERSEPGA